MIARRSVTIVTVTLDWQWARVVQGCRERMAEVSTPYPRGYVAPKTDSVASLSARRRWQAGRSRLGALAWQPVSRYPGGRVGGRESWQYAPPKVSEIVDHLPCLAVVMRMHALAVVTKPDYSAATDIFTASDSRMRIVVPINIRTAPVANAKQVNEHYVHPSTYGDK